MTAKPEQSLYLFPDRVTSEKKLRPRKNDVRLQQPERHDWNTPEEFLSTLYQFSPVALDPFANENSKVIADKVYRLDKGEDALKLNWRHSFRNSLGAWITLTFSNPPYGDFLPIAVQRASDEAKEGAEIILLTPSRTDTEWFEALQGRATALAFWKGRLMFEVFGKEPEPAPFASLVSYFGPNKYRFADVFSKRAKIWLL